MAELLDGRKLAKKIKTEIKQKVQSWKQPPGLAVVLVGDNSASKIYVNHKEKACREVGFYSQKVVLPADTTQEELKEKLTELNNDTQIHGILVQLPLPDHLDEQLVMEQIDPEKDVDVFHPYNVGQLYLLKKLPSLENLLAPCTPKGIMSLLAEAKISLTGKRAVILGRSNLVGKPLTQLLTASDATVTLCHSKTPDLETITSQADILVAAIGRANFVTTEMIKPGTVVIDVGINRTEGGLTGDVDFAAVEAKASYITPVPGGVGPMTIATLLQNTLLLATQFVFDH